MYYTNYIEASTAFLIRNVNLTRVIGAVVSLREVKYYLYVRYLYLLITISCVIKDKDVVYVSLFRSFLDVDSEYSIITYEFESV